MFLNKTAETENFAKYLKACKNPNIIFIESTFKSNSKIHWKQFKSKNISLLDTTVDSNWFQQHMSENEQHLHDKM